MMKQTGRKFVLWLMAMIALLPGLNAACAQMEQTDVFEYEWHLQPAQPQEGKAHLSFWCDNTPVKVTHNPEQDSMPYYWDVYYSYQETNGVAFTVERVTEVYFNEANEVRDVFVSTGKACSHFCRDLTVQAGEVGGTNTIRPVSSDTGYGVAVSGTDANGNELTFGFYVPLSQQILRNYTLEDVTAPAVREDGKAYMVLTPNANPAPLLVKSDDFEGGNGWFYGFSIENGSDVAFTPTELTEVYFYEGQPTGHFVYSTEQMMNWGAPAAYEGDAAWTMTGGMPEQELSGVGYLLSGIDANGNELEFGTYIELERK